MKKHLFILILCLTLQQATAQEFKFPQNLTYPYGHMPSTFSTENFEKWYSRYKASNLLPSCNGGIAVNTDNGVKVEAMGWAMIIAAYMGDKSTFDGLYKFYKSKIQSHGMMAWLCSCGGISDAGSASDGDLDVAFSLLVATWQWGDEYREEAAKTIKTVKKLITSCSGTSVIVGGYSGNNPYGGCDQTDISYYTPAFFREFAKFTGDSAWSKLADDTYIILNNAANDNTGLVPDWHTWKGGQSPGRNYRYSFDACRVPWRIALDYLWNGNEEAKKWCITITDWVNTKVGIKNVKDGYNLDGSSSGSWHNMSFVGAFAVAAMCNNQEISDEFAKEVASMGFDNYWYHAFLGNCYMLTLSGNMWRPGLNDTVPKGIVFKNKITGKSTFPSVTLQNTANRELCLSGIGSNNSISLSRLSGEQVKRPVSIFKTSAIMDISTLGSGCYILTIHDKKTQVSQHRVFSVY